jgi:hypothetical protein
MPSIMVAKRDNPFRLCFLFNAQRHQMLHGLSTAALLGRRSDMEVTILSPAPGHLDYARWLADRLGGSSIRYEGLQSSLLEGARRLTGATVPPKILTLLVLARRLRHYDAIALPERTSIVLKRLGVRHPRFIHLDHGAGDRAAGFDPRIRLFDYVLMAGAKHRRRMLRDGLIREGAHAVVGYPKFEAADAARDPAWAPFPGDDRPIVLYNPHFSQLGSWEDMGAKLMAAFAAQDRYNLIVAPHVRLLDGQRARTRWQPLFDRYRGHPRLYVDPGSDRSIDMTYTSLADLYVGDVSSQVYEYLRERRPCLFLDAHGVDWREDENYAHWHFGPVAGADADIITAIDQAFASHGSYRAVQDQAYEETFDARGESGSQRAADAIAGYLQSLTVVR